MPQARDKLTFVDKTMQNNHDGLLLHLLDCHTAQSMPTRVMHAAR